MQTVKTVNGDLVRQYKTWADILEVNYSDG